MYKQKIEAVDGDWFNTTAIKSGPFTFPGPGNIPAIRSAVDNQFNWVAELTEIGEIEDVLALLLHADQASAQFDYHFDIEPVLDSINLDFPINAAACANFKAVCEFSSFQEAIHSFSDAINKRIVSAIQFATSNFCPVVREKLNRSLVTGVPAWWTQALK